MSIICGAIRWLKDHNERAHSMLMKQINNLEGEKQKLSTERAVDWLNANAREIELSHLLYRIKLEHTKIKEYEAKIDKLKNRKKEKRNQSKQLLKQADNTADSELEINCIDEDDIVLEDVIVGAEFESEEEDENTEEKYEPIKVKFQANKLCSTYIFSLIFLDIYL